MTNEPLGKVFRGDEKVVMAVVRYLACIVCDDADLGNLARTVLRDSMKMQVGTDHPAPEVKRARRC